MCFRRRKYLEESSRRKKGKKTVLSYFASTRSAFLPAAFAARARTTRRALFCDRPESGGAYSSGRPFGFDRGQPECRCDYGTGPVTPLGSESSMPVDLGKLVFAGLLCTNCFLRLLTGVSPGRIRTIQASSQRWHETRARSSSSFFRENCVCFHRHVKHIRPRAIGRGVLYRMRLANKKRGEMLIGSSE